MKQIFLRKNEERRLRSGHQWVFSNELLDVDKTIANGDVVALYSFTKQFLGIGFFNRHSLIAYRHLSAHEEPIDQAFFERRLDTAWQLRNRLYPESLTNTFRLVHGESDYLPGLVVDKFADVLSVQTFSVGMEVRLDTICAALVKCFSPQAIVLRNESELRKLEGLEQYSHLAFGELAGSVEIVDAGIKYAVDVLHGHKTGFFLDQRENRKRIRPFAKGARVLDVFTSDGGFALNALYAGAREVVAIDASADALTRAQRNAALNGFQNFCTRQGDAFLLLEEMLQDGERFDLVILDPPSLTKSKKNVESATKAYRKLNRLGLLLVKSGGYLATASCSHHVSESEFLNILAQAAADAKRSVKILERATQAPDHPILPAMPETQYLKFALLHVADAH
ncbi:MAG: class I SAM-dependent rRNA methyltransferase [Candidatus Thermochlorobacter sp.]